MNKLLPKTVAAKIPALYSQEDEQDPMVHVKLFALGSGATWYLTEYSPVAPDGTPNLGFGYVTGLGEDELGYVSLDELAEMKFIGGIPRVERDRYFTPKRLSEVKATLP